MNKIRTDGYPRPQFAREKWQSLNGIWEFEFDDLEDGLLRNLHTGNESLKTQIQVPFAYQCKASGIGDLSHHEVVWYRKEFTLNKSLEGERILLCFNAVDYESNVWVNGYHVCHHIGGYSAFSVDVSKFLRKDVNTVVVQAIDRYDVEQPRGKQFWKQKTDRCWYHGTTGIWQNVWLEAIGCDYLANVSVTPDIDKNLIVCEATTAYGKAEKLEVVISYRGENVKVCTFSLDGKITKFTVDLLEYDFIDELHFWTVENPNLYDIEYRLIYKDAITDNVQSYFGFRKIHRDENGIIYLNNMPLYQRLVLDQGYWEDSDLTPPDCTALLHDIQMSKKMGFNGARKHQKVEDPYFYYYADKLGFLVWAEMPSAYRFNQCEIMAVNSGYLQLLRQLHNHPSIICFVPLNESWGVRKMLTDENMKNFARSLYSLTKAIVPDRLVSTNDGWENIIESDILSVHDYAIRGEHFPEKYTKNNTDNCYPMWRRLWSFDVQPKKLPMIMTEFGGVAIQRDIKGDAWGYGGAEKNDEGFFDRISSLFDGIYKADFVGYCYTQLTDVKQEVNGILDANHNPKVDLDKIAEIIRK